MRQVAGGIALLQVLSGCTTPTTAPSSTATPTSSATSEPDETTTTPPQTTTLAPVEECSTTDHAWVIEDQPGLPEIGPLWVEGRRWEPKTDPTEREGLLAEWKAAVERAL